MTLPRVSVVIPAYNAQDTIAGAIKAVLAQSYQGECELIVVDDGSTDGTRDLINNLSQEKPYIRLISNSHMGKGASVKNLDMNKVHKLFTKKDICIKVDLKSGSSSATAWTCDFSKEYVVINSEYST